MSKKCKHLDQIKFTTTDIHVCAECVKVGDRWVHLRLCMICGNVGCCDSSKNKHATKHFHHTTHPLIRSIEPGESWIWCYVDEIIAGDVDEAGCIAERHFEITRDVVQRVLDRPDAP